MGVSHIQTAHSQLNDFQDQISSICTKYARRFDKQPRYTQLTTVL